jgi:hypothetical protein
VIDRARWVEGRNVAIEFRWAGGREDRMLELASDFSGGGRDHRKSRKGDWQPPLLN